MTKVKTLTQDHLNFLRTHVRMVFESRCPGEVLKETTFKGAYDDLRDDIIKEVSDMAPSVSTQRLRKLFYYTNPAVCPEKQLETPAFGKDFLDAIECYAKAGYEIPHSAETIVLIPESLLPAENAITISQGSERRFYPKSGAMGGGIAGALTATLTIIFADDIGYPPKAYIQFNESLALIFLTQFTSGVLAGWLCGMAIKSYKENNHKIFSFFFKKGFLFFSSMVLFALIRQVAVRDAFFRDGGGLLGQPDFEMLGTAMACSGGLLFLVGFMRRFEFPTFQQILYFSFISAVFAGIISFGGVFAFFRLLEAFKIIPINECNCFSSPSIFRLDFPYPERIVFVVFFGFIFNTFILYSIRNYHLFFEKAAK